MSARLPAPVVLRARETVAGGGQQKTVRASPLFHLSHVFLPPCAQLKSFIFPPIRMVGDATKKTPEPRVVLIKKSQLELGVHLCGGNLHGVFVAEVEDDSPAKGPDGLVPGDLILEVSSAPSEQQPGCSPPTRRACRRLSWHRRWRSTASAGDRCVWVLDAAQTPAG